MEIFKVTIKNFGKLTDAVVRVGKLTVFAGRNNTGKSFVSKALYSIFGAMKANHLAVVFGEHLVRLKSRIRQINRDGEIQSEALAKFTKAVEELRVLVNSIDPGGGVDELSAVESALPSISSLIDRINTAFEQLKPILEGWDQSHASEVEKFGSVTQEIEGRVRDLLSLKDLDAPGHITNGLGRQIRKNFLGNFQVSDLPRLCSGDGESAHFGIEGVGSLHFQGEAISMHIMPEGLHTMQQHSEVLYLESPVFWRLKDALESAGETYLFPHRRISDVPKYFRDMASAVTAEYSAGDIDLSDVLRDIHAAIGGSVVVNDTDDLIFREEDGGLYPLSLAAMGVANFGMLGLLIEKNLLDDSTFLFIDEPEAHLHPAWQVKMAETLFALAEKGVNVVIATHSAEILKWLEVKVKKSPEAMEKIALNHFKNGMVEGNGKGFTERLEAIQEDLGDPYYRMFHQGLS